MSTTTVRFPNPDDKNDTSVDSGEPAPATSMVGAPPDSMDHNSEWLNDEPQD